MFQINRYLWKKNKANNINIQIIFYIRYGLDDTSKILYLQYNIIGSVRKHTICMVHYRIQSGKSVRKVRSLCDDLVFDTIRYRKTQNSSFPVVLLNVDGNGYAE